MQNSAYYLPRFHLLRNGWNLWSWNTAAFLLSFDWFLYRRMWFLALMFFSLHALYGWIVANTAAGLLANYLYCLDWHSRKDVLMGKDAPSTSRLAIGLSLSAQAALLIF